MAHDETLKLASDPDAARGAAEILFCMVASELAAVLPASTEVLHIGCDGRSGLPDQG